MNYQRQESPIDFTGNALQEAERADYAALHGDEFICEQNRAEELMREAAQCDAAREEAQRIASAACIGTVTRKITIDSKWMEGKLNLESCQDKPMLRYDYPVLAALEAEYAMIDAFSTWRGGEGLLYRIHISRITLSEGWSN